jgi:cytochrome c peroxidase
MEKQYLKSGISILSLFFLTLITISCKKEANQVDSNIPATAYQLQIPFGFPAPYLSEKNPLTYEGIELGKNLYSDPILSSNGRSCSTCHKAEKAFSSELFIDKEQNKISVMSHQNLAFRKHFTWNGALSDFDLVCMGDFEPEFFNTNPQLLFKNLKEHSQYPYLFQRAFGVKNIELISYDSIKVLICYAITQYMKTMINSQSKFDLYRQRKVLLSPEEYNGMIIFFSEKGDCFHCHGEPLFTDDDFHNNGLSSIFTGINRGREVFSKQNKDIGKFITPTLRNISKTFPYMHDGRFKTLEEVVEFYNSGVMDSETLDPIMNKRGETKELNLTPKEKSELVSFLKTLNDADK